MTPIEDRLHDIAFYLEIIATDMVSHGDTRDHDLLNRIKCRKKLKHDAIWAQFTTEDDTNGTNKP